MTDEVVLTNEELFNKAIQYAFCGKSLKRLEQSLKNAKDMCPDPESILTLCTAIDDALLESGLDWDASVPNPDNNSDVYKAKFEESYSNECKETRIFLEERKGTPKAIRSLSSNSGKHDCHHYDICKDSNHCPKTCQGSRQYLNELDHLLHYLAVQIWRGRATEKPGCKTDGIMIMMKKIDNVRLDEK